MMDQGEKDFKHQYLTLVFEGAGTLEWDGDETVGNYGTTLYYSKNKGAWTALTNNGLSVSAGDSVRLKCTIPDSVAPSNGIGSLTSTATHIACGNIMSLLYGDDFVDKTIVGGAFTMLFSSSSGLRSAENLILPASIAERCYIYMFTGCTNLETPPVLPATEVAPSCYASMFYDCTSLATAPALLATTLANSCYLQMFYDCTSLTTAPVLPATALVRYCYEAMFYGCTSLNYIKAMFTTTPGTSYTKNWVKYVAASGTFVKNSAATWTTTGVNGVPSGWTVQTADT